MGIAIEQLQKIANLFRVETLCREIKKENPKFSYSKLWRKIKYGRPLTVPESDMIQKVLSEHGITLDKGAL